MTDFLMARIAEDEAMAGSGWGRPESGRWCRSNEGRSMLTPQAVLAECESKRHLLDEALVWGQGCLDVMARYMAEVYADHPAYDEAWRP